MRNILLAIVALLRAADCRQRQSAAQCTYDITTVGKASPPTSVTLAANPNRKRICIFPTDSTSTVNILITGTGQDVNIYNNLFDSPMMLDESNIGEMLYNTFTVTVDAGTAIVVVDAVKIKE